MSECEYHRSKYEIINDIRKILKEATHNDPLLINEKVLILKWSQLRKIMELINKLKEDLDDDKYDTTR